MKSLLLWCSIALTFTAYQLQGQPCSEHDLGSLSLECWVGDTIVLTSSYKQGYRWLKRVVDDTLSQITDKEIAGRDAIILSVDSSYLTLSLVDDPATIYQIHSWQNNGHFPYILFYRDLRLIEQLVSDRMLRTKRRFNSYSADNHAAITVDSGRMVGVSDVTFGSDPCTPVSLFFFVKEDLAEEMYINLPVSGINCESYLHNVLYGITELFEFMQSQH